MILFIVVLFLCITLLGFWIYWFTSNNIMYTNIANFITPELLIQNQGIKLFIAGIILLILIATGLILIFDRLIRQTEKNRIYDDFINSVSHELKTPLASIQLCLETLQQRRIPEHKQQEFLEMMSMDTARLNKLIGSIIEMSLLDDNRDIFNPEELIADETISKVAEEAIRQFKLSPETLSISGKAPCTIRMDRRGLHTILNNLINNAIKYNNNAVKIGIHFEYTDKKFSLYLSDNGIGIPMASRKEVFKKFSRLKDPESPNVKGTGIGLFWCSEILKRHGGRLSIVNNKNHQGCIFKIELPVYPPKPDKSEIFKESTPG
ncbi:MAG: HAMP domain-containing histidine kinase [Spirochaetales bacterium]|nr:HAMP domain-containing histidine kinase [Spirochaetales bacterium]